MILKELKDFIVDSGLKKSKIADKLGVTPQHLSGVLSGKRNLSPDLENRIRILVA